MSQYDTTLDLSVSNTSHFQLLDLIGANLTVLDVGCATGYLAEALVQRGCVVSGIEFDPGAAAKARKHLDRLVVADLNGLDFTRDFGDTTFDVIVFGDVLEHLPDPLAVLRRATQVLSADGSVVISVPNVTHGSVRLALLQGRWEYSDTGLLDRTHVTFFTRDSLLALLTAAGLKAADVRTTTADPLAVEVAVDSDRLPPGAVDWVREQPDATVYQFVVRAVRDGSGPSDASEEERLTRQLVEARQEAARLESELRRAEADVAALRATRTLRVLAFPRAAHARLRVLLGRTR